MMKKILVASFLAIMGAMIIAMNPASDRADALGTPPAPAHQSIDQTDSPSDLPSPAQSHMRNRGVRRNLATSMGNTLNPAIYTVLPLPRVTPPNLNIHSQLIINDWFFAHVTSEQEALLNRIATVIPQAQRIMLSSEEYRLFQMFPTWIFHELVPFVTFSDDDVETTEVVPTSSSESSDRSAKRSKKRNPTGR